MTVRAGGSCNRVSLGGLMAKGRWQLRLGPSWQVAVRLGRWQ